MRRLLLNTQVLIGLFTIGGLLAVALWPRAALIEMATVTRGPLIVTVDEEGVTRVRERFVVSSPVAGRVLRIELDPGDAVKRGQGVVQLRAEAAPLLDERARAEAQAAVESAKAVQGRARAEEQRARATVAQLERDLTRVRELAHSRLIAARDLDTQEAQLAVANESLTAATFAVQAATSDLQRAESRLMPTTTQGSGRVVRISSPVSGVVLKRLRESESIVPAGDPLLEIGDPTRLEIVSDLLSTDAVRPGRGPSSSSGAATRRLTRSFGESSRPASPKSQRSVSKSNASMSCSTSSTLPVGAACSEMRIESRSGSSCGRRKRW
jgi:HlyD family secretion protein